MGNHESKKLRAERHNAKYAAKRGESELSRPKSVKPQSVNVGAIGHVDAGKTTLTTAINKSKPKPRAKGWWRKYALPDICWALLVVGAFSNFCYWVV